MSYGEYVVLHKTVVEVTQMLNDDTSAASEMIGRLFQSAYCPV